MASHKAKPTHEQLLDSPAQDVPAGKSRDMLHPWSMRESAERSLIALYVIVTLAVLIRGYALLRTSRKVFTEDYAVILTWVIFTGAYMPVGILLARAPMGVHQWDIILRQFAQYLFLQYLEFILWGVIMLFLKLAIILQYIRFLTPPGIRDLTFWTLHVVLWANVFYYVAFIFLFVFICNPRAMFWDKTITDGKCFDVFKIIVISAVICVVSDLTILLLPLFRIYQLNLTPRMKIGLGLLFTIGIFSCATSSVRLYYNIRLWQNQEDITYQLGSISYWGTAQIPAGFLVVCLPSLPKVVKHFRGKPWYIRVETCICSRLRWAKLENHEAGSLQNPTIGGDDLQKRNHAVVISDIEFHSLVVKTQKSVSSRIDGGGYIQ